MVDSWIWVARIWTPIKSAVNSGLGTNTTQAPHMIILLFKNVMMSYLRNLFQSLSKNKINLKLNYYVRFKTK